MTVTCKFGCGEQIFYHSEKFSDGFVYKIPMHYESDVPLESLKVHKCSIFEKELDVFSSSEWDGVTDVHEPNRYDEDLADMLEHLAEFYYEWEHSVQMKYKKLYPEDQFGDPNSTRLERLTPLEIQFLIKSKNIIQSDMNYISYPDVEFILSSPGSEFKEVHHLLILGKIYQKLEMYSDAFRCYSRQNRIYEEDKSLNPPFHLQQKDIILPLMEQCMQSIDEPHKELILSELSESDNIKKSQETEISDSVYTEHTQKHISNVEEKMRKFIMKLYDDDISSIRKNFPQISEAIDTQRKKDEKLLYEPINEHELDKITFGQLIKILENRNTRKIIQERGIYNLDDVLRHLILISEYRNPLDHSKGLVDGDLAKNYKIFVISNCMIIAEFFEKQNLV
jgi:tetratricopeptide (TPR) repeat protein